MTVYKQPRDEFQVRICTDYYRIYGKIHLVPSRSTADLFNAEQKDVVPVTEATLFSAGFEHPPEQDELRGRVPFLGLNRSRIWWVFGGRADTLPTRSVKDVRLAVLYPEHLLAGEIQIPSGVRVTDHIHTAKPFMTLHRCRLYPIHEGQTLSQIEPVAAFEFVVVNTVQAIGVIES